MKNRHTKELLTLYAWGHALLDIVKNLDDFDSFPEAKDEAFTYLGVYWCSLREFCTSDTNIYQTMAALTDPITFSPKQYALFIEHTNSILANYTKGLFKGVEREIAHRSHPIITPLNHTPNALHS